MEIKTREQVIEEFSRKGISVSKWAKQNGFSPSTVASILQGKRQARIGTSHNIAVKLGIKEGVIRSD